MPTLNEIIGGNKKNNKVEPLPEYLDETQMDEDAIREVVMSIHASALPKEDKTTTFKEKYSTFADKYPMLFNMACSDDFDVTKFDYMMRIRKQIADRERTVENASAEIGKRFFGMYHKPQ